MAATEEDIADMKEEVRKNIGAVKNHCPFGCSNESLDEFGYCHHLVGFTNAQQIGDRLPLGAPIDEIVVNQENGMKQVNGRHKRQNSTIPPSKEVVQPGDKLVNPEERQFVNGVHNIAKMWASSRVYRKDRKKAS